MFLKSPRPHVAGRIYGHSVFGGKLGKSQPHKAKQRAPTPTPTQQPVAEFKSEFYITRFAAFQNDSYGLICSWGPADFWRQYSTQQLKELEENERRAIITIGYVDDMPVVYSIHRLLPEQIFLERIICDPFFVRKGLATSAFHYILAKLDGRRRKKLVAVVNERDEIGLRFYKAMNSN